MYALQRSIIFMFVVALAAAAARAQERFKIERLAPENGLSQSYVYSVIQDSRGFLWAGTRDGLNRYDGYQFTVFKHDPLASSTLSGISASLLTEDADANIWVLSDGGLNVLRRRTLQFSPIHSLARWLGAEYRRIPIAMVLDRAGIFWIATTNGVVRYDPRRDSAMLIHREHAHDSLLYGTGLFEDRSGRVWATSHGLDIYLCDATSRIARGFRLWRDVHDAGRLLHEDASGRLTVLSTAGSDGQLEIARFDPATRAVEHIPFVIDRSVLAQRPDHEVWNLDSAGNLWLSDGGRPRDHRDVATSVIPFDSIVQAGGRPIHLRRWRIPLTERILSFCCDRSGTVWLGTMNGLFRVAPTGGRFTTYLGATGDEAGPRCDRTRAIHRWSDGELWIGTDFGLLGYDPRRNRWKGIVPRGTAGSSVVNVLYPDRDGTMLTGTNAGLEIYDRHMRHVGSLVPYERGVAMRYLNAARTILRDRDGMLWVGTRDEGVTLLDRQNRFVRHFTSNDDSTSLLPGVVWNIIQDHTGIIWFGTSGGLCRWLPDRACFRRYRHRDGDPRSLCGDNICAITEDDDGNVWMAAHGAGVNRYDRATDAFEQLTTRNGLAANSVYAVLPDSRGRLWISSNIGLMAYDRRTHTCRTYTAGDGIQGNEFTFNAFFRSNEGELFFGGANGVTGFRPERIRDNPVRPLMAITAWRALDSMRARELAAGDTIVLSYDQNFVSFDFAALDFANPSANHYAYMLEGLNGGWVDCGTRHVAGFTKLDPGTYVFRVTGTNNDGLWAARPFDVVVRVIPPFWRTWWFQTLGALAAVAIVSILIVVRIRSVRNKERQQRRQVESELQALRLQMNPHFIFNALGSIQHLMLRHEERSAVDYLTRFARLVRATLENSRETFVSIAEEVENLRLYLTLEALRFDARFAWRIDVAEAIDQRTAAIPTMLLQPLVENAIRHGLLHRDEGGSVVITIARDGSMLRCVIEDDGVGRGGACEHRNGDATKRRSFGLTVTRERIDMLRALTGNSATMTVTDLFTNEGVPCGTRVELLLPTEEVHEPS